MTPKLEDIGFYTLSDARVKQAGVGSPLWRCELVLTARCNFKCPYCRHVGGKDLDFDRAAATVDLWASQGLKNIRFSGGEPTLYPGLVALVNIAKANGIERIALSTNGSADIDFYRCLMQAGVNDISVSLDACCAEDGDKMAGGVKGAWEKVVENIRILSLHTYVTVGVVLTEQNAQTVNDIVTFADSLGVSDIRVIPAAQDGAWLTGVHVDDAVLDKHPILKYRIRNMQAGKSVRGLKACDANRCGLVVDDMAVMGDKHYPCIIYMRERGKAIGTLGRNTRFDRHDWSLNHDTHADPICSKNCLDVCVDYNNRFAQEHS
jgi:molybdenum cofactor biosynthesis enzyme MoaA